MRARTLMGVPPPALAVLLLLAAGCADDRSERAIPEGRYRYEAVHETPGQSGDVRLHGVMVVASSERDSLAGHWEVDQLHPEMDLGGWNGSAYEVMAHPTYFGILLHRLRREGEDILCEGEYTWMADAGGERSVPVTCSISPDEGERPEMPAVGAEDPIVRPIDADTVPPRGLSPDARGGPRPDSVPGGR